jgi:hypothetical protein
MYGPNFTITGGDGDAPCQLTIPVFEICIVEDEEVSDGGGGIAVKLECTEIGDDTVEIPCCCPDVAGMSSASSPSSEKFSSEGFSGEGCCEAIPDTLYLRVGLTWNAITCTGGGGMPETITCCDQVLVAMTATTEGAHTCCGDASTNNKRWVGTGSHTFGCPTSGTHHCGDDCDDFSCTVDLSKFQAVCCCDTVACDGADSNVHIGFDDGSTVHCGAALGCNNFPGTCEQHTGGGLFNAVTCPGQGVTSMTIQLYDASPSIDCDDCGECTDL